MDFWTNFVLQTALPMKLHGDTNLAYPSFTSRVNHLTSFVNDESFVNRKLLCSNRSSQLRAEMGWKSVNAYLDIFCEFFRQKLV